MEACPRCSAPIDDLDRFCAACGQALAGSLSETERAAVAARGRALKILLGIATLMAAISAISTLVEIDVLERIRDGIGGQAEADASDQRQALIQSLQGVTQIITVVLWLLWQHRAQANLRVLRSDARTSPGWAVGWWFIPVANLFMPYRTVRELWQGSTADGAITAPSTLVSLWWVAFLASSATGGVAGSFAASSEVQRIITSSYLGLASDVALLVAGVLAIVIVAGVVRGQVERGPVRIGPPPA